MEINVWLILELKKKWVPYKLSHWQVKENIDTDAIYVSGGLRNGHIYM